MFLLLTSPPIYSQCFINDHFEGDTLACIWVQTDGDTSNYYVANSQLTITNTLGGTVEPGDVWRYVGFRTEFNAPDSFYISSSFDFNRDRFKQLEYALYDESSNLVIKFRIWDSPSDWVIISGPCGNYETGGGGPDNVEIFRFNDTLFVGWSNIVFFECVAYDTIKYLEISCAQYVSDDDGFNPITIDSIFAVTTNRIRNLLNVPSEYTTIQEAIDEACNGDTVLVADGTYTGDGNRDIDFGGKNIILLSENGSEITIIDCEGASTDQHRGFIINNSEDSNTVISGFTITNGYSDDIGGAILIQSASPRIENTIFLNNQCFNGALFLDVSSTEVIDCSFMNNVGSAIKAFPGCDFLYISNCEFIDNLWAVEISANAEISDCVFAGNGPYGAIYYGNNSLELNNCTLFGNSGPYSGGAIRLEGGADAIIRNCIIASTHESRAIYVLDSTQVQIECSDIVGNEGGDWTPPFENQLNINGNISLDPWFCDTTEHNFAIMDVSPCAPQNNSCSTLIGALDLGCSGQPSIDSIFILNEFWTNVMNHTPNFGWLYSCPVNNPEDSFSIAVGTDDDWEYAEMWNPAPYPGPDTFVTYAGSELIDGETYYLRLRVHNSLAWSEWYEMTFRMNSRPSKPVLLSPGGGEVITLTTPELYILNSTDAEGDALSYDIFVYDDSEAVWTSVSGIAEQNDSTGWMVDVPFEDNIPYIWTARADDGYEQSEWSLAEWFWVNSVEQFPSAFDLTYPPDTGWSQVYDFPTDFWWHPSFDPDPMDTVYYKLLVATDSGFMFVATFDSISQTTYSVPGLEYSTHYWWKVYAIDTKGNMTESNGVADFLTWVLGDANRDGNTDVGDAVFLINFIFKGGAFPEPYKIGDANGDCEVNVGDVVYLIAYVFKGGPPPEVGCAVWVPPPGK
jgi:hypothetical protein